MTPPNKLAEKRDSLAQRYGFSFHGKYTDGMTVTNYCNADVPDVCFSDGFDACYKELMPQINLLIAAIVQTWALAKHDNKMIESICKNAITEWRKYAWDDDAQK